MGMLVTLRITTLYIFQPQTKDNPRIVVILTLQLDDNDDDNDTTTRETAQDIYIRLYDQQAPKAAHYIQQLASLDDGCTQCTLYRGEPVPPYWGSPDYPNRSFNGGRWGPPYALVQGAFISSNNNNTIQLIPPPAESTSTPVIQKGMVAWAGGKGRPHFFIALADHPEWNHEHTVWGEVVNKKRDLSKLQALLLSRPLVTTTHTLPVVSNFVTPISFTLQMASSS
jgi:cyclophilin family peptidyl-prolyl cis-trans isomerase